MFKFRKNIVGAANHWRETGVGSDKNMENGLAKEENESEKENKETGKGEEKDGEKTEKQIAETDKAKEKTGKEDEQSGGEVAGKVNNLEAHTNAKEIERERKMDFEPTDEMVENLHKDIMNSVYHIFGIHTNCR